MRPIKVGISACLLGDEVRYDGGHKCDTFLTDLVDRLPHLPLAAVIEEYRRELVPLIVPITLFRHHVRVHNVEDLAGQLYLDLHPKELMLRNHV